MSPTKNGEIIEPMANAPYARPICPPSKPRVLPRYVAMLTYQDPQMKYCRNMKILSLILRAVCIEIELMAASVEKFFPCEKNKMTSLYEFSAWWCLLIDGRPRQNCCGNE